MSLPVKTGAALFNVALRYAKAAIANEVLKAAYQAVAVGNQSAYNVAMADAFKAPKIKGIDSSQYTGQLNNTIRIDVVDDFRVDKVHVALLNQVGHQIAETFYNEEITLILQKHETLPQKWHIIS